MAGGWAACPSLAEDQDIWILEPIRDLMNVREEILVHLAQQGFDHTEEGQNQVNTGYPPSFGIIKVAEVRPSDRSHPIHLLLTSSATPEELIAGFDVSTHQIAITHTGHVVRGVNWTSITVPPVVISINKGKPTTPQRLRKIAQRYGHGTSEQP